MHDDTDMTSEEFDALMIKAIRPRGDREQDVDLGDVLVGATIVGLEFDPEELGTWTIRLADGNAISFPSPISLWHSEGNGPDIFIDTFGF